MLFYKKNLKSNNLVKILYSSSTVDCQVYTVTEVIYCTMYITVVYCTVYAVVKGTVQRDFRPSVFSSFALAWVKIFSILVWFRRFIPIFLNQTGIWYRKESISPGYHKYSAESMYTWVIILRRVILPGVSYWGESCDFMWLFQILFKGTFKRDNQIVSKNLHAVWYYT